jgi:SpoVK/Ycf46/Vps4 family AAA+-type ATPase
VTKNVTLKIVLKFSYFLPIRLLERRKKKQEVEKMSKFHQYLKAGYPALWIETHEEFRAIATLSLESKGYAVYSWDIVDGLKDHATNQKTTCSLPVKVLQMIPTMKEGTVIFLKDFHKFLTNIEVLRSVKNLLPNLKASDKHIVFISPVVQIPVELEKDITVLPFALPTVNELMKVAEKMVKDNDMKIEVNKQVVSVGKGLTLQEAENAMARSLVEKKDFVRNILEEEKLQVIKKSGIMELYESVAVDQLGGLDELKQYVIKRKVGFENPDMPTPKGILLVGVPGGGKSLSAKVIASVLDCPLIRLDIGALKGSKVGESEARMRQALAMIDALGFVVVWMDEIEKVLTGVQSSGQSDAGTTSTMFGTLLTWMQESKQPHYIIATCNDIEDLLTISQGALLRRFDDIFFVDLPTELERKEIIDIMNKRYKTKLNGNLASRTQGWTGAEIEKFVVSSIYEGEEEAFPNVKPISQQNAAILEKAREWAKFNARTANSKEVEQKVEGRKIRA